MTIPGRIRNNPGERERYAEARRGATARSRAHAFSTGRGEPIPLSQRAPKGGELRSTLRRTLEHYDALLAAGGEELDEALRGHMERTGTTSYSTAVGSLRSYVRELRGIVASFDQDDADQATVDRVAEAFVQADKLGSAATTFRQRLREETHDA